MQTKNLDKLYLSALRASAKKRMSSGGRRPVGAERTAIITTAKRSARSKHARLRMATDKIGFDEIVKMFGLPDLSDQESSGDTWAYAHKQALQEGLSEEDAEEKAMLAEQEEQDEHFGKHHDAVMRVADELFGEHQLELVPKGKGKYPFDFRITPKKTWKEAAKAIVETINGVGYFHFNSIKEWMDSGPYTLRDAVLKHVHWISSYPEVYGDRSAKDRYYRSMR